MSRLCAVVGLPGRWVRTSFGQMWLRAAAEPATQPPLLLVHGLGRGGAQLVPLALAFGGVRSVLVPDLFDLGGRSRSRSGAMSIVEHADALAEVLEAFGPSEVVGISLGGWVATWLAARYADLVRGLYLVNPAGTRRDAESVGDLYRQTARGAELYRRVVAGRPFLGVPVLSRLLERSFSRVLQTPQVRALLDGVREEHFVEHAIADIRCRVHLLLARDDRLLSAVESFRIWSHRMPNLEGTWVEDASHNLGYEAFEVLLDDLASFLKLDGTPPTWVSRLASHLRVPPATAAFNALP